MSSKRGGSRKHQSCGDVTIYESADADVKLQRLKKSNLISREKTFDEIPEITDEDIIEKKKRNRKKSARSEYEDDHSFSDYPIDIWFLISEHVKPEDIKNFSLICTKTLCVVSSAKFWFYLYRKHYNSDVTLPLRLQPDCMVRLGGLRAYTIRSLFYTYPQFVNRIKNVTEYDYQVLLRKQCVGMWYKQDKSDWIFCFKFKHRMVTGNRLSSHVEKKIKKRDILEMLTDIFMNKEEGCQVLTITTKSFRPLPFFSETPYLSSIIQSLSHGFTQNKIKLEFSDKCSTYLASVVYDPASFIRVLDWWHPNYESTFT